MKYLTSTKTLINYASNGDNIQTQVTINGTPMNLPAEIIADLGDKWRVRVHYSDGTTNNPEMEVPK